MCMGRSLVERGFAAELLSKCSYMSGVARTVCSAAKHGQKEFCRKTIGVTVR